MGSRKVQGRDNEIPPLGEALADLIKNQAVFVGHLDQDRLRFARIERDLDLIKAMLIKHEDILQKLPEAIREKIGFTGRRS